MSSAYVGRLAPSPTGALHLGNARTFLVTWLRCRSRGGHLILRMEDLDHPRVKAGAAEQAYEDLRWLGLDWDTGPDLGGPHAPYVQTRRLSLYQAALDRLQTLGLLYPCICTRRDIEAAQSAPHPGQERRYPGTCRDRPRRLDGRIAAGGPPPALRCRIPPGVTRFEDVLRGPQESDLEAWSGDFVVARTRDQPGYQLAVVVDDAAMEVTEVVRADDLLPSTHRQLVLYDALGLRPPAFLHLPLVVGPDGRRLAKRHGDTRVAHLREAGVPPERVVGWLAHTCGWALWREELPARELLHRFTLETIPLEPVVVDARVLALLD
jgi:glutamyl-tRNA synthetase